MWQSLSLSLTSEEGFIYSGVTGTFSLPHVNNIMSFPSSFLRNYRNITGILSNWVFPELQSRLKKIILVRKTLKNTCLLSEQLLPPACTQWHNKVNSYRHRVSARCQEFSFVPINTKGSQRWSEDSTDLQWLLLTSVKARQGGNQKLPNHPSLSKRGKSI